MADTRPRKHSLNPVFERMLDHLCEQRDIDGLRELLLGPMDVVTNDQERVPKIIAQCRANDATGLYFTLAHPDMRSEYLLYQDTDTSYNIGSPITECISSGSAGCLREILNSPFITKDALEFSALSSCYARHVHTILPGRIVECVRMILYHKLCDTTVMNSRIRVLNSHIQKDTTLLSEALSSDNSTITDLILERYNDEEFEELLVESVVQTLLSVQRSPSFELVRVRLCRMKAIDRVFSADVWKRIEHIVPPALLARRRPGNSYIQRLAYHGSLFPNTWEEACECDGRLNFLISHILYDRLLNRENDILRTTDSTVIGFMIENIETIMTICTPRCDLSCFKRLIALYSPERIVDLRFETPSGYNLFQLYCQQVGAHDSRLTQDQMWIVEKMGELVDIGINPNTPFPDGRTMDDILSISSAYIRSEVRKMCVNSAGKFTKGAVRQ